MHLFLVRTPALDRLWHLHPERQPDGSFEAALPSIESGRYTVFADIVDQTRISMDIGRRDRLAGPSRARHCAATTAVARRLRSPRHRILQFDALDDGTRVVWHRDSTALGVDAPMILRFEVLDQNGKPATDLDPYMGMAAHAEIISSDLQVFAHIHPSGIQSGWQRS